MLIGTHTLMPVCGCLLADNISVAAGRGRVFPTAALWTIAVFGALPDLCTPHISLEERYTSWSHSVWFMACMLFVAGVTGGFFQKGSRLMIATVCWLAAGLHLAADAVSGGIAWKYPWGDEVIGRYWIHPETWIWYDAFFIILTWFLVRVMPHLEARGIRKQSIAE